MIALSFFIPKFSLLFFLLHSSSCYFFLCESVNKRMIDGRKNVSFFSSTIRFFVEIHVLPHHVATVQPLCDLHHLLRLIEKCQLPYVHHHNIECHSNLSLMNVSIGENLSTRNASLMNSLIQLIGL